MAFLRNIADVSDQMIAVVTHYSLLPDELRLRLDVRDLLELHLREVFEGCDLDIYGSSANGFGCHGCDMDIYLDLHLERGPRSTPRAPDLGIALFARLNFDSVIGFPLKKDVGVRRTAPFIQQVMRSAPLTPADLYECSERQINHLIATTLELRGWQYVVRISHARTPIVKLQHGPTELNIDIGYTCGLPLRNTALLKFYNHLDPCVRPLVFTIRRWGADNGITGQVGLSNYCITMLVMFFLMHSEPDIFPAPCSVVIPISDDTSAPENCPPVGKRRKKSVKFTSEASPRSSLSPATLLLRFFKFYSTFNFSENVIQLYSGTVIPGGDFHGSKEFKFSFVNVQDPYDLDHNIAKAVDFFTLLSLHEVLDRAVNSLEGPSSSLVQLLSFKSAAVKPPSARKVLVRNSAENIDGSLSFYCLTKTKDAAADDAQSSQDYFGDKVTICKEFFRRFLRCEVEERQFNKDEPYARHLPPSLDILAVLQCKTGKQCFQQLQRDVEKNKLSSLSKEYGGREFQWCLECLIGDALHERTTALKPVECTVVLLNHFVDWYAVYMGIVFKTESIHNVEFLRYVSRNLSKFLAPQLFGTFGKTDIASAENALQCLKANDLKPSAECSAIFGRSPNILLVERDLKKEERLSRKSPKTVQKVTGVVPSKKTPLNNRETSAPLQPVPETRPSAAAIPRAVPSSSTAENPVNLLAPESTVEVTAPPKSAPSTKESERKTNSVIIVSKAKDGFGEPITFETPVTSQAEPKLTRKTRERLRKINCVINVPPASGGSGEPMTSEAPAVSQAAVQAPKITTSKVPSGHEISNLSKYDLPNGVKNILDQHFPALGAVPQHNSVTVPRAEPPQTVPQQKSSQNGSKAQQPARQSVKTQTIRRTKKMVPIAVFNGGI